MNPTAPEITSLSTASLIPYARNARTHTEAQVQQIAASIREFGFTNPVLVKADRTIIAGHGRVQAAQLLGMESIPCLVLDYLSDTQAKALAIADNKIPLNSGWDAELLKLEMDELREAGVDMGLLAFGDGELEALLESTAEKPSVVEDNFVPPEVVQTLIKPGDLIELGIHRLMCGDSTKAEDVERLMAGAKADLCFTSPPYNADTGARDGDIFNRKPRKKLYGEEYGDNLDSSDYVAFARAALALCFEYTSGVIFWNVSYNANARHEYIEQIFPWLPYLVEQVCWKKHSAIPIKGSMRRAWEPVYIFSTDQSQLGLEEVESNFWDISNTGCQADGHKACFPVALPAKGMSIVPSAATVYDPFLGSGTTLIAAEQLGRKCYGMEISPQYCQVIVDRYKAQCEKSGKPFECKINGEAYEG